MTASTPTTTTSLEAATAAFATTSSATSAAPPATTAPSRAPPATTATGSPRWNFAGHPKFNGRCSDRSTNADLGASPKTYHDDK